MDLFLTKFPFEPRRNLFGPSGGMPAEARAAEVHALAAAFTEISFQGVAIGSG
jgi:hypothetical protein